MSRAGVLGGICVLALVGAACGDTTVSTTAPTTSTAPTTTTSSSSSTTTTTTTAPSTTSTAPTTTTTVPPMRVLMAHDLLDDLVVVAAFEWGEPYDRDTYSGGTGDLDGDCISTRNVVLMAESLDPIDMDGCVVSAGRWVDPWSGAVLATPADAEVDHHVPLAHAHRAGAWLWDHATRQAFYHDVEEPAVRNAVAGATNQAKADRGPDEWRPEAVEAWCAYAVDWIVVKHRWRLQVTETESAALVEMLATCAGGPGIRAEVAGLGAPVAAEVVTTTSTSSTTTTAEIVEDGTAAITSCERRNERVTIANQGEGTLDLAGWVLHDEERRHDYTFGPVTVESGGTVIVLTGDNQASAPNEILWKSQHVWNNDGDTAFLLDPSQELVDQQRCS